MKVVPPLEPLALRQISPRFLSEKERIQIGDMASTGMGSTAIGEALGRSASTISRELRRNLHPSGQYRPFHAQAVAAVRRRRTRPLKLMTDPVLRGFVEARLRERWSPQQISRALRVDHPDDAARWVAAETIYQAIYRPGTGLCRKSLTSPLRTGRDHRRGHTRQIRARRRFAQPMLSVHERGFDPTDRSEAGHWEGDLIVGPHHRSAIGTLVERQTRYVKLLHLPALNSIAVHDALVRRLGELPPTLRRTLTWDQGTEMAKHLDVTTATGTKVYFCDAASPWQRARTKIPTAPAPVLPQVDRPLRAPAQRPRPSRGRTQSKAPRHPQRPKPHRPVLGAASLRRPPPVAMTTGIQAVAMASFSSVVDTSGTDADSLSRGYTAVASVAAGSPGSAPASVEDEQDDDRNSDHRTHNEPDFRSHLVARVKHLRGLLLE